MNSSRRKKSLKTSTIIKIVVILAIVVVLVFVLVRVLRSKVSEQFSSSGNEEVQSAQVETGSISTVVSGSGTLTNEDSEDTFIPATVDITEVYVEAGDTVEKGDMLASVNSSSVVKAMNEVQEKIDSIDDEIGDLEEEDVSTTITAGMSGRVKKIYCEAGDAAADVIYDHKALMLLSVDGYMAVDIETDQLSQGDSVTVTRKDGTELTGTVDSVWAGSATILVSDDSLSYQEKVTVKKDGEKVGTAKAYIHEMVSVTGFTGTISAVNVSVDQQVSSGTTLVTLTDVSSTVNYASLLEKRADYEDELQDLIAIYKEGAVYAKNNGLVTAISETEDETTTTTTAVSGGMSQGSFTTVTDDSDEEDGTTISICPTDSMTIALSVDETDILSLEVGQTAEVTISSLSDETYEATLTDIDTVGSSSNGVTSYTATLTLDRVDGMPNGMSASAAITIEGRDNALLVPVEAVHKTSSTSYVYTEYDEETGEFGGMTEVTTGLSNSNYTEITSGLSEGDTVYYTETEEEGFDFGGMGGMEEMFGGGGHSGGSGGAPSGGDFGGGGMPSGGGRSGN